METVFIDGSFGEGGGQVLRTSLTLAAITGKRLHIENIRANRPKPGLGKQHLGCVEAAKEICQAKCAGTKLGSTTLDFEPGEVRAGEYRFDIGSAGSASLVIQTILPILFCADPSASLRAGKQSTVTVTGGTHNPWAPPYDFLEESFLPAIGNAGFHAGCRLLKYGFYPAGGGEIVFEIQPGEPQKRKAIELSDSIIAPKIFARIYTSRLPVQIAQKQSKLLLCSGLNFEKIEHKNVTESVGAGNCVVLRLVGQNRTMVFTGFGSKGKPSEKVINEVVTEARNFLNSGAAIDHYLADQLLIYMAIQKTGQFLTDELSNHLKTNIEVIKKFLPVDFAVAERENNFEVVCRAF